MFRCNHHHQGGHYLSLLKLQLLKQSIKIQPTDAQENFFKRSIKIYIKTAPTCFGVITIIREGTI